MLFVYYFLAVCVGLIASPVLLFKKKARFGLLQKLGLVPHRLKEFTQGTPNRPIWFHAVSVGEFNACFPLIRAYHNKYPHKKLIISCTTGTGHQLALQRAGSFAEVVYFPYDLPWATSSWLNTVCPTWVVIVETEIWPGFYHECRKRGIPLVVVNGRISPRSFAGHRKLRSIIGPTLRCASLIAAQTEQEASRYRELSGQNANIHVVGNLKFDGLKAMDDSKRNSLREKLNLTNNQPVIVAGFTHEGEETAILNSYKTLAQGQLSNLRLILAPRHPERFEQVGAIIESFGFNQRRFSHDEAFGNGNDVYMLDAIGHLTDYYSVASVAFVGGTLVPVGGHNLLEPYVYSVPVICGPRVEKTADAANALKEIGALTVIGGESELTATLAKLLQDQVLRETMGQTGRNWLLQSQGAVGRTLALLESLDTSDNKVIATAAPAITGHLET